MNYSLKRTFKLTPKEKKSLAMLIPIKIVEKMRHQRKFQMFGELKQKIVGIADEIGNQIFIDKAIAISGDNSGDYIRLLDLHHQLKCIKKEVS